MQIPDTESDSKLRLPSFFVIGAAKAGTTSLHALLDSHPDLFMPEIKEPEFFARDDLYAHGLESYGEKFASARPDQMIGEASTIYTLAPLFADTAARIKTHVPEAKLIYVLRQPVDRAYSFYTQITKNYQNGTRDYAVHRSFEDFVIADRHAQAAPRNKAFSSHNDHLPDVPELCLAGSDYVHQVQSYLKHFPREAMLFLKFEDFVTDRQNTVRKVTDFLGIDPLPDSVFEEASVTRNISDTHFENLKDAASVQSLNKKIGPLSGLRKLMPSALRKTLRKGVVSMMKPIGQDHRPPPMKQETRAALQVRFQPQFAELSKLTGLNFDDWVR
jgi:hypothetical protein